MIIVVEWFAAHSVLRALASTRADYLLMAGTHAVWAGAVRGFFESIACASTSYRRHLVLPDECWLH